jgi:hypothetical protein
MDRAGFLDKSILYAMKSFVGWGPFVGGIYMMGKSGFMSGRPSEVFPLTILGLLYSYAIGVVPALIVAVVWCVFIRALSHLSIEKLRNAPLAFMAGSLLFSGFAGFCTVLLMEHQFFASSGHSIADVGAVAGGFCGFMSANRLLKSASDYVPAASSQQNSVPQRGHSEFGIALGASLFWRAFLLLILIRFSGSLVINSFTGPVALKQAAYYFYVPLIFALFMMKKGPGILALLSGQRLGLTIASWRRFHWMLIGFLVVLAVANCTPLAMSSAPAWIGRGFVPILLLAVFCVIAPRFLQTEDE